MTRTLLRKTGRALTWLVAIWAVSAVAGWAVGGFGYPPILSAAGGASLEPERHTPDARVESCFTEDGVELRGIFVPSDADAPIVVHFAESGGSVAELVHARNQYAQLSDRGFASLAVDYRGIGRSDGSRSPGDLGVDGRAIWDHALALVGGDERRLLIRACSIGTVVMAGLLEEGARPAALLVHAPVEAETVVDRFGRRLFGPPWLGRTAVWLSRPWFTRLAGAATIDELARFDGPVYVVSHPDDLLLVPRELERLTELGENERFELYVPSRLPRTIHHWATDLHGHFDISWQSFDLSAHETRFLARHFPELPPVTRRADALLDACDDPALPDAIAHPGFRARLERLVGMRRLLPVERTIAAAAVIPEPVLPSAFRWIDNGWYEHVPPPERSLGELLEIMDVGDDSVTARRWIHAITVAWFLMHRKSFEGVRPVWTHAAIERAIAAQKQGLGISIPWLATKNLGVALQKTGLTDERDLARAMLKAAWLTGRVVDAADGGWTIEPGR